MSYVKLHLAFKKSNNNRYLFLGFSLKLGLIPVPVHPIMSLYCMNIRFHVSSSFSLVSTHHNCECSFKSLLLLKKLLLQPCTVRIRLLLMLWLWCCSSICAFSLCYNVVISYECVALVHATECKDIRATSTVIWVFPCTSHIYLLAFCLCSVLHDPIYLMSDVLPLAHFTLWRYSVNKWSCMSNKMTK